MFCIIFDVKHVLYEKLQNYFNMQLYSHVSLVILNMNSKFSQNQMLNFQILNF